MDALPGGAVRPRAGLPAPAREFGANLNRPANMRSLQNLLVPGTGRINYIPANVIANAQSGNCSGGWFPAVRPRQENFTGPYGVCGATILVRANWVRR